MTKLERMPERRLGALVALTVASTLGACGSELDTPVANQELLSMEADYVAYGMLTYVTANGVREARIEADTAFVYEDSSTAILKQMTLVFYDENGNERATVTGLEGDWNQETNRMVARGEVVLFVHTDSSRIESPEIFYEPDIDKVWSDSTTVRTLRDGTVQSGTAFESDMSFENVSIANLRGGARRIF